MVAVTEALPNPTLASSVDEISAPIVVETDVVEVTELETESSTGPLPLHPTYYQVAVGVTQVLEIHFHLWSARTSQVNVYIEPSPSEPATSMQVPERMFRKDI